MADFNIRSESVDVEQIMKQIRSRIREKRGVDYTEEQIRELATVRLEKFLDPRNLRSDLLEQFRKGRPPLPVVDDGEPPPEPPPVEAPYVFDDQTLFHSHRGPLRYIRKLLRPILKLFFNPNTLNQILHTQAQFNVDMLKRDLRRRIEFQQGFQELKRQGAAFERSRAEWNLLYYEVLHNLVLETTRTGIEVKNLRMRVEALSSRLDFSERRVRALEGVVQYRPEAMHPRPERVEGRDRDRDRDRDRERGQQARSRPSGDRPVETAPAEGGDPAAVPTGEGAPVQPATGEATARRRRRRRRGRRGAGMPQGATPAADGQTPGTVDEVESIEGGDALDANDATDATDSDATMGNDEGFEEPSDRPRSSDPDQQ